MLKQVDIVKAQFETNIKEVNSLGDLDKIRVEFLGKKGLVTALMPLLRDVPNEQKREMGQAIIPSNVIRRCSSSECRPS